MVSTDNICPVGFKAVPQKGLFGAFLKDPLAEDDIKDFKNQGCSPAEQKLGNRSCQLRSPEIYSAYLQIDKGWQIPPEKIATTASQPRAVWQPKIEPWSAGDNPISLPGFYHGQHDLLVYNLRLSFDRFHEAHPTVQMLPTCGHEMNTPFYPWGINQAILFLKDLSAEETRQVITYRKTKYQNDPDFITKDKLSSDELMLVTPTRWARTCVYLEDRLPPWLNWTVNFHAGYPLYQYLAAYLKETKGRLPSSFSFDNFVKDIQKDSPEIHPENLFIRDFRLLRQCEDIQTNPTKYLSYFDHLDKEDTERELAALRQIPKAACQQLGQIPIYIGEFAVNAPKPDREPLKGQAYDNFFKSITSGELADLGIAGFLHFDPDKTEAGQKMHFNFADPEVAKKVRAGLADYPKAEYACQPIDQGRQYPPLNFDQDLEYIVKYSKFLDREIINNSPKTQDDLLYAFKYELIDDLLDKGQISATEKEQYLVGFVTQQKATTLSLLKKLCANGQITTLDFIYRQIDQLFGTDFIPPESKSTWGKVRHQLNNFFKWKNNEPAKPTQELKAAQVETLFRLSREIRYAPAADGSGWEVKIGPLLREPKIKSPYSDYLVKYTGPLAKEKAVRLVNFLLAGLREPYIHRLETNKLSWWQERLKRKAETPGKLAALVKWAVPLEEPNNLVFNPAWYQSDIEIPQVTKEDLDSMAKDLREEDAEGNIVPLKESKLSWKEFILNFTDKLYTAAIAPYAEETAEEDLADAMNVRTITIYRDYKLARYKAWGDALFSLKKYDQAIKVYEKIIHFPYDAQHDYPLYFFEAYFNLADCYKIKGFIKNDPKLIETAIKELKAVPIKKSNNLGYQTRAVREIALLYQTLLEWEYRSLPLRKLYPIKQEVRKYLTLALHLNQNETRSKDFDYNLAKVENLLKAETYFKQATVTPQAKLVFNLPADILSDSTFRWDLLDDDMKMITRGETAGQKVAVDLASMPEPIKTKTNLIFSAYYRDTNNRFQQFSRSFLVDPDPKNKQALAELATPVEYPASDLSEDFAVNYLDDEDRWSYRVNRGESFEIAKTFIQFGELYLNFGTEEDDFLDDRAKIGQLQEAESWFKLVIGGDGQKLFADTIIDCSCRNDLLAHQHLPKEFYLYRARAHWKLGETQRRIAYLSSDVETINKAIDNLEQALELMSRFKGNAPSDFSIYDWVERHTLFEIRAALATAYVYRIFLDASNKDMDLSKAEKAVYPAVDNLDLVEDMNVKLGVMLALFEAMVARLYRSGLSTEFATKLDKEVRKLQSDIEQMLQGKAGGNSYLFNRYFSVIDDYKMDSLYFTNQTCTGSGYSYLRCKVNEIDYNALDYRKVIEDSENTIKLFGGVQNLVRVKLLMAWARALENTGRFDEAQEKINDAKKVFDLIPPKRIKNRKTWIDELNELEKELKEKRY